MSYAEPARNGYCYHSAADSPETQCRGPPQRHAAILYFEWHDLGVRGPVVDHCAWNGSLGPARCDLEAMRTTASCERGTIWACPPDPSGGEPDHLEGNSHPFHPVAPPHDHADPCAATGGSNLANHGGSSPGAFGCDFLHETADVDVYFSGQARPLEPAVRFFLVDERRGSNEVFYDFHAAYPDS